MKKSLLIVTLLLIMFLSGCTKAVDVDCTVDSTNEVCKDFVKEEPKEEEEDPVVIIPTEPNDDEISVLVLAKLAIMTTAEKAGQMVQAERGYISPSQVETYGVGSILSGGGSHPSSYNDTVDEWYQMVSDYQDAALKSSAGIPVIYGIDAVHGNNNLFGATIFPHNVGLGAANDKDLVYDISKATAEEMLATGITWTFAPALSVTQNIKWGRSYEGYSENPEIHQNLTASAILGFQDMNVSATAKHFLADGGTINGIDQGNADLTEEEVRALHLLPYIEAVNAGVDTVMISYSSINNAKMHGSSYWINDVLKTELGFEGFVISDWNAIHQLGGSYYDQVVTSINSGVDMLMEPQDWRNAINAIKQAVTNGDITEERLDDAVYRILYVKYKRDLIDNPYYQLDEDVVYNTEHQELAREAVRKSLVLLQNDNDSLPLDKNATIFVTGAGSTSIGLMSGGWTTYWQGNTNGTISVGTTITEGISDVLNLNGGSLVTSVADADTVVVVFSEVPYSEGQGYNTSLTLTTGKADSGNQQALDIAIAAHDSGKNVIGILLSGRPLLLEDNLQYFDSFIASWLPGSEGGTGISDVLFGDYDFTGTLPYTWPLDISQIGYTSVIEDYDETKVQYPYGYGLTYN